MLLLANRDIDTTGIQGQIIGGTLHVNIPVVTLYGREKEAALLGLMGNDSRTKTMERACGRLCMNLYIYYAAVSLLYLVKENEI